MACILVPAAEAIVTTVAAKKLKTQEINLQNGEHSNSELQVKIPLTKKLHWLSNMLWGGTALLAFEHIWHGEVTPFFPFLTAANNPADFAEMLHELSTVGVTMAILVTIVWGGIVYFADAIAQKNAVLGKKENQ